MVALGDAERLRLRLRLRGYLYRGHARVPDSTGSFISLSRRLQEGGAGWKIIRLFGRHTGTAVYS